jgi:dTDP-4-dehydrorhamnose reductase
MSSILLFGADGQVGWQLQRALAPLGAVRALNRSHCDLSDLDAVRRVLREQKPSLVVNASAYTAVDKAESEGELAQRINAEVVGLMAEEARRAEALFVHYSTDYVFDGRKDTHYLESDATNPQSAYGRSKRAGELAIEASGCRALVFRTSWVFAARGHNFVKSILRLAGERDALRVVADQVGSPTSAELIADVTALALATLRQRGEAPDGMGLYHLVSANPVSWHAFATAIVATAQATPGFALKAAPSAIAPITTADYPLPAPRPANSRLSTAKLEADFGLKMPDWQPYLARMLDQLGREQPVRN